jgi:hypothetical protein
LVPTNTFAQFNGGGSSVTQTLGQSNSISASNSGQYGQVSASGNTQTNIGANVADVHIGSSGTGSGTGTGTIPGMATTGDVPGTTGSSGGSRSTTQTLLQSNSLDASNSGAGGTVLADNNTQTNIGANIAGVHVGGSSVPSQGSTGNSLGNGNNRGTTQTDSQTLGQANSLDASNSGAGGTVLADNNTQTNFGVNAAHVRIGSTPTTATQGLMGWLGGGNNRGSHSTTQTLGQANSITANNTGDNGGVSASGNTQTNLGLNLAHIHIGSFSGTTTLGLVGNTANTGHSSNNGVGSHTNNQTLGQANSIAASNSGTGGTVLADNNQQTQIGINAAHVHIPNLQNLQNSLGQILGSR